MTLADKIKKLTNAYGVSGDEFRISKIAAEMMAPYCDRVEIDDFGNVLGYRDCGIPGAKTVMLDAHIDQIGFLITEVTEEGFLRFTTVGGVDQRMLLGSELTVLTKKGPILGIVAAIPPHLQKDGDDKKSVPIPEMVVDIGMTGEQAKKVVRVGDYMAFANDAMELQGDALCGKAFDDRACLVCLLHTMDLLQGKPLAVNVVVSASTKEETGFQGGISAGFKVQPDYAIAVDVTHARTGDAPQVIVKLGDGPNVDMGSNSNPKFAKRVIEVARAKQIPHIVTSCPAGSGTNAWPIQMQGQGVTTLVVSLPLKYMHSPVEMLRMSDVKNVGKLLAAFIETFDGRL
ncbi:MAG: M42 family peptidase [Clostridia bacterium]|nr:M42 family peptidase [Clostridia bacterium]